jgi:hypothetical protein
MVKLHFSLERRGETGQPERRLQPAETSGHSKASGDDIPLELRCLLPTEVGVPDPASERRPWLRFVRVVKM